MINVIVRDLKPALLKNAKYSETVQWVCKRSSKEVGNFLITMKEKCKTVVEQSKHYRDDSNEIFFLFSLCITIFELDTYK